MIYGIKDRPKTFKEWSLYTLQQVCAVIVATLLISTICGTPYSSCLFGAYLGTIIYQLITGFRSPMFISSCGATVAAVCGALALPGVSNKNYLMVAVGGFIVMLIYAAFGFIIKKGGIEKLEKLFPPTIIGAVTIVIGLNLSKFLVTYTNNSSTWEMIIAISTLLVIAIASHYFKGFAKTIPFLFGLAFGYTLSLILTLTGVATIIDFSKFDVSTWSWYPDFSFMHWNSGDFSWSNVVSVILLFVPVSICALLEHYSDHKCLSNIIGTDLTKDPGLHRTLLGDGVASFFGTVTCGLPNTSYGESIATIGFSKVASVWVITSAAAVLGLMSFFAPFTALIASIPSCVFGGCAAILYGFIAASGLKLIINSKVNLENNKNLIIVSAVLCVGVSGVFFISESFAGVSLAMVLGFILNLVMRDKHEEIAGDSTNCTLLDSNCESCVSTSGERE